MKFLKSSNQGFTLVELLVVVSVVSMLASVVLATVSPMRAQARDAKRKQEVHQIDLAIQSYIADNGRPPELSGCSAQVTLDASNVSGCVAVSTAGVDAGVDTPSKTAWQTLRTQLSPYMKNFPVDPCGSNCTTANGTNLGYVYLAPAAVQYYSPGSSNSYQTFASQETGSSVAGSTGYTSVTTGPVTVSVILLDPMFSLVKIGVSPTIWWSSSGAQYCTLLASTPNGAFLLQNNQLISASGTLIASKQYSVSGFTDSVTVKCQGPTPIIGDAQTKSATLDIYVNTK